MPRIATEKQKCLSRVAYDRIKVMILQKELMPGQFINESQLQETLELGRTPVREAVLALAPGPAGDHPSPQGHRGHTPYTQGHPRYL